MAVTPERSVVVGREHEIAVVQAFVGGLETGPSALVLEGEAGVGKTTLWLAGVAAARVRGHELLETRPAEAEAGFAFAGLGDLLGGVLDEVLDALPGPRRTRFALRCCSSGRMVRRPSTPRSRSRRSEC